MNKERLAAFTDAIVAIVATIMVLELAVPSTSGWQGLMENLPVFLVYIVSFSQIYLVWNNHHDLFEKAEVIEG
ncbi:TMEM175 family protein [Lancefieldella sp. Marseille-Q7238]|uniref:TMEM175 family protein n=1 Tax=Lancefieldella sp. Marseille-Q7238 TaxID=3022127 RepID=UPI0024A91DA3|nr:TMEM175 family protein [Lancefieldella sp. Marseille-Q7238]